MSVKGQRDSASFRTKREATAWAAVRETELRQRAAASPGELHTFADALTKYAAEVSPHKRGQHWEEIRIKAMLRDPLPPARNILPIRKKLADLTPDDLGQWRNARLEQVAPGTVLRESGLLSAVLECARREWRWITVNPMSDVRKPRAPDHREVLITRPQIRRMLSAMGYHRGPCRSVTQAVAVAFLLALRTGMRAGEICALTWADILSGYCKVTAVEKGAGKTGKRDVPLTPKAERLIESMHGFDADLVFGLSSQTLDAMFRKYRVRAGLSGFTFHDSRHTAATWLAPKLHILDLCKMFGWKDPKRAMVYYNPKAADIAKRLA